MSYSGWKYLFYTKDLQDTLESNGNLLRPRVLTAFMVLKRLWYFPVNRKGFPSPTNMWSAPCNQELLQFTVFHMWLLNTQENKAPQTPFTGPCLKQDTRNTTVVSVGLLEISLMFGDDYLWAETIMNISTECFAVLRAAAKGQASRQFPAALLALARQLELLCKLYIQVRIKKVTVHLAKRSVITF